MGEALAVILSVIQAIMPIIQAVGVVIEIKKGVDDIGNTITEIVQMVDNDGDGSYDDENTIMTIDLPIPDLSGALSLVDRDGVLGIGYPLFQIIDGTDIGSYIDVADAPYNLPVVSGIASGLLLDMDYDRAVDDFLIPLFYDITGDGFNDFGWIIDINDNNLPDASPDLPFYPVGSDEFLKHSGQILEQSEYTIMNKPLDQYTVTEGILFIILVFGMFSFVSNMFSRRKVY